MYELGMVLNNFLNKLIMQNKIFENNRNSDGLVPPNDLARIGSEQGVPFSISTPKLLT